MSDKTVADNPRSRTISFSAPSGNGDVMRASFPGPMVNLLCEAHGDFDFGPAFEMQDVKVLIQGLGSNVDPYLTIEDEAADVIANGVSLDSTQFSSADKWWNADGTLQAFITNDPDPTWNRLSVLFIGLSVAPSIPDPPLSSRLSAGNFQALPVDSCTESKCLATTTKQTPTLRTVSSPPSLPMLPVLELRDGWARYSFFSLTGGANPRPLYDGYQLASPGCCKTPLTARQIVIAAGTVDWRPRPGRNLVITRPHGILDSNSSDGNPPRPMLIGGLTKYCLFVHQKKQVGDTDRVRVPVESECCDHPQRILLDPNKPIYVQVNNVFHDLKDADGTLDFWVKVLT